MSTIYSINAESSVGSLSAADQLPVYKTVDGRVYKASGEQIRVYVLGTATSDKLGFYGVTSVTQPTSSLQAAITTSGAVSISATQFGYATAAQADAIVSLANQVRANLVTLGLIKGS